MFKTIVLAAAASMLAVPALANTGGTGAGLGGTVGFEAAQHQGFDFNVNVSEGVSGSSGSGFSADMAGVANDGISVAGFGGVGIAGTQTNVTEGFVTSVSGSAGLFGGVAFGQNASFDSRAMNFAQSEGHNSSEFNIDGSVGQTFEGWGQLGGNIGNWSFDGF